MKVVYLNSESQVLPIKDGIVVALGYFDGLHIAHQKLIEETVQTAKQKHAKSGVMTFNPSPKQFLGKQDHNQMITPHNRKIDILNSYEVDYLFVITFDEKTAKLGHKEFAEKFIKPLQVIHLVTGFDFRYGHKGKGTVNHLVEDGDEQYGLSIIDEVNLNGEKISSSKIRDLIRSGQVDKVKPYLGRDYTTEGIVIHGFKRGRELGFPTANTSIINQYVIPDNGVYVVKVEVFKQDYFGMCNVGYNPTFSVNNNKSIEVHILNFDKDIYNEKIDITWLKKIREERKFSGRDDLIAQLTKDKEVVREYGEISFNDIKLF